MRPVLDVYDDGGAILRRRTLDAELPDWVKEASYPEDAPDDLFAVAVDHEDVRLRKFACDTPANTVLSMLYFRDTSGSLGPEFEKAAACRLVEACGWYGLRPPADLQKKADVSGSELAPRTGIPKAESEMKQQRRLGLQAVKQTKLGGKVNLEGIKAYLAKQPSASRRLRTFLPSVSPLPFPRGVDASGTPAFVAKLRSKKASLYADPVNRRYPLDAFDDVVDANRYMDKYASEFDPRTRRTIAAGIYKRSCDLRIPPGKAVREIALRKAASASSVRGHLEVRATFYGRDTEAGRMCQALMAKVASLHPEVVAETIAQLDAKYGGEDYWNSHIPEPWDVVYEKKADAGPADYSYDFGTWKVSGSDLVRLAKTSKHVDDRFNKEFAEQFRADPIGFFDHLPRPEKEVLGRMARDVWTSGSNTVTGAHAG